MMTVDEKGYGPVDVAPHEEGICLGPFLCLKAHIGVRVRVRVKARVTARVKAWSSSPFGPIRVRVKVNQG